MTLVLDCKDESLVGVYGAVIWLRLLVSQKKAK